MAPNTYYFALSFVLVFGLAFHVTNLMFFRKRSRTLTGNNFKPDAPEYTVLSRHSSRRNLTIATLFLLLAFINLAYSSYKFVQTYAEEYSLLALILIPSLILLTFIGVFIWANNAYRDGDKDSNSK